MVLSFQVKISLKRVRDMEGFAVLGSGEVTTLRILELFGCWVFWWILQSHCSGCVVVIVGWKDVEGLEMMLLRVI